MAECGSIGWKVRVDISLFTALKIAILKRWPKKLNKRVVIEVIGPSFTKAGRRG